MPRGSLVERTYSAGPSAAGGGGDRVRREQLRPAPRALRAGGGRRGARARGGGARGRGERVRGAHSTMAGRWCAAAAAAAASAGACACGAGSAGECACSAALGGRWRALFWWARRPASCE